VGLEAAILSRKRNSSLVERISKAFLRRKYKGLKLFTEGTFALVFDLGKVTERYVYL